MGIESIESIITGYTRLFSSPTRIIHFSRTGSRPCKSAVVVYLPDETEQLDPSGNLTLLGTAGLASAALCADYPCEFGIEIRGSLDTDSADTLAESLVHLTSAPLATGQPFRDGQILTNVSLPSFPRFTMAMLIDWDAVDGFRFPKPSSNIGLLRILPLFETEADYVESFTDRRRGYLSLINQGLIATDPERDSIL